MTFRNSQVSINKGQIKQMAQKHKLGMFSSLSRKGSSALNVQRKIIQKNKIQNSLRQRNFQKSARKTFSLTKTGLNKDAIETDEIRYKIYYLL